MAIQHRDIIKVMPIAPVTMQNECPMPPQRNIWKATLWFSPVGFKFLRLRLAFVGESSMKRNEKTSYKLQSSARLWTQKWELQSWIWIERSGLQSFSDGLGKDQLSRCPRLSRQYNGSYNMGDCGKIGNMNIFAESEFLLEYHTLFLFCTLIK